MADRKLVTRERILGAAFDLFAQHGFADASIDMIARRAYVAHGTVLAHFGRKSEIFAAVARLAGQRYIQTFHEVHDEAASFLDTATSWVRHLQSDSAISCLMRSLFGEHPHRAIGAASDVVNAQMVDFWCDWLRHHRRQHVRVCVGDTSHAAHTIVATLSGLATVKLDQSDYSLHRSLTDLMRLVEQA